MNEKDAKHLEAKKQLRRREPRTREVPPATGRRAEIEAKRAARELKRPRPVKANANSQR